MSYHNIQIPAQSNTNTQGEAAPVGYHYMPDGTLMSDAKHGKLYGGKIKEIESFNLDLSDIKQAGETRPFSVNGWDGAAFSLEIKNDAGQYYNFVTDAFQTIRTRLENKTIRKGSYSRDIVFPSDNDGNQYDIYLFAEPGTKHANYNEVRFGDGSIDINSSTGSGSLLLQKVIYQYATLTLTMQGYSIGGVLPGTFATATVSTNRGKSEDKTSFSLTCTATSAAAYRILKQPAVSDILSFIEPVVGDAPVTLPGENIYPNITTEADSTSEGGTTVNGASTGQTVTTHVVSSTIATVGDRVLGNAALAATTVTVTAVSGGSEKTFTISESISIADDLPLTFSNQMNYSWPINNYVDKLKEGMIVLAGGGIATDTVVGKYQDTITIFPDTEDEEIIIKNERPALDTLSKKPTIVKGLVTVQEGNIIFNKQQVLALRETTLKIGGYGENEILRVYGWDVKFTNLAIALTAPTTTTREATSAHAVIDVNSKEGVINNISRVSGIGIDSSVQSPLITSGGGATGTGDWTMGAVQTLENGITLTIENTSRIATITGNIEIIKAGTANQTLRFDVNKLLSIT